MILNRLRVTTVLAATLLVASAAVADPGSPDVVIEGAVNELSQQLDGRKESGLEIRSLVKTKVPRIEFHHYDARSDDQLKRLFAVIREYLDALDRGRFNYRPGWGCSMCDFRQSHCRSWCG